MSQGCFDVRANRDDGQRPTFEAPMKRSSRCVLVIVHTDHDDDDDRHMVYRSTVFGLVMNQLEVIVNRINSVGSCSDGRHFVSRFY